MLGRDLSDFSWDNFAHRLDAARRFLTPRDGLVAS